MCLGVPGQIIQILDASSQRALISISGVRREVNLACVLSEALQPAELVGQWVLVHVGFAMSLIDEAEAQKTLQLLAELDELQILHQAEQ